MNRIIIIIVLILTASACTNKHKERELLLTTKGLNIHQKLATWNSILPELLIHLNDTSKRNWTFVNARSKYWVNSLKLKRLLADANISHGEIGKGVNCESVVLFVKDAVHDIKLHWSPCEDMKESQFGYYQDYIPFGDCSFGEDPKELEATSWWSLKDKLTKHIMVFGVGDGWRLKLTYKE